MEDAGENGRNKKMGDAQHQLLVLNHQPSAKCFSRRCTCGLAFLTIGLPGNPLPRSPTATTQVYLGLFDRFKLRGITEVARLPVGLPYLERGAGGGAGLGPHCSHRGPGARQHEYSLAASALRGAACNTQKGCVGVGVGEVF